MEMGHEVAVHRNETRHTTLSCMWGREMLSHSPVEEHEFHQQLYGTNLWTPAVVLALMKASPAFARSGTEGHRD